MESETDSVPWTRSKIFLMTYGFFTFTFYFLQYVFAYLNHRAEGKSAKANVITESDDTVQSSFLSRSICSYCCNSFSNRFASDPLPLMNVQGGSGTYGSVSANSTIDIVDTLEVCAVGYKESPELFKRCLESIRDVEYGPGLRITIVVDGNSDPDDFAMVDVAKEVFGSIVCLNLTHLPDELPEKSYKFGNIPMETFDTTEVICITQPHAGKRNAMYTAFCIAGARKSSFVLNTDSDTVLDKSCLLNMMCTMKKKKDKTAAVAGVLRIYGPYNWLVKMTAARYRVAFEVERSAQGYWGSVLCVSGPLGLYKLSAVNKVKEEWVHQHFWGKRCTFGDDRAMSNCLLKERYEIAMCTNGIAWTEAPCDFTRFVSQQTRWCRSFWRELFLNLTHVPNSWTWAEICYYALFPIVLLTTVIADDFIRSGWAAGALLCTSLLVPLLRMGIVNVLFGYQEHSWWYGLYSFMFVLVLLPIKIFALCTMNSGGWETDRFQSLTNKPIYVVYMWWLFLIIGATHYIYI